LRVECSAPRLVANGRARVWDRRRSYKPSSEISCSPSCVLRWAQRTIGAELCGAVSTCTRHPRGLQFPSTAPPGCTAADSCPLCGPWLQRASLHISQPTLHRCTASVGLEGDTCVWATWYLTILKEEAGPGSAGLDWPTGRSRASCDQLTTHTFQKPRRS
jgi:hypothetical protein